MTVFELQQCAIKHSMAALKKQDVPWLAVATRLAIRKAVRKGVRGAIKEMFNKEAIRG